ncbi:MAG: hypothetical protein IT443_10530 [Phycisphaeraceae bacterium]|nr:hypothetical protein [Phycisphaeraceae bacterium]
MTTKTFKLVNAVENEQGPIARCSANSADWVCASWCGSEGSCHDGCCPNWWLDAAGDCNCYRCSW